MSVVKIDIYTNYQTLGVKSPLGLYEGSETVNSVITFPQAVNIQKIQCLVFAINDTKDSRLLVNDFDLTIYESLSNTANPYAPTASTNGYVSATSVKAEQYPLKTGENDINLVTKAFTIAGLVSLSSFIPLPNDYYIDDCVIKVELKINYE